MGRNNGSDLERQRRFAEEVVKGQNPTQAAIRAGYAPRGAAATGRRLMNRPKIQADIQRLERVRKEIGPQVNKHEIITFLTTVMRWNGSDPCDASPEILHERIRAAELLGKYLNLEGAKE